MGVATGLILEFEFGTNWSNYSWLVGDVFGAPLAIEGIVAFFMEATFVGVMFFGWGKVSDGFHLASTWLTGLGATISAWWILVANAWMQYPVGQVFNPDTMRNEMTSFADVALSPFAIDKFFHTVLSAWIVGAVFAVAVSCYYLIRANSGKCPRLLPPRQEVCCQQYKDRLNRRTRRNVAYSLYRRQFCIYGGKDTTHEACCNGSSV